MPWKLNYLRSFSKVLEEHGFLNKKEFEICCQFKHLFSCQIDTWTPLMAILKKTLVVNLKIPCSDHFENNLVAILKILWWPF